MKPFLEGSIKILPAGILDLLPPSEMERTMKNSKQLKEKQIGLLLLLVSRQKEEQV